jgi:beta-lactamase superfamily II metal-dependent hydrolase
MHENQAKEQKVNIHILNVGKGDSILLEFPDKVWGVVDCNRLETGVIPAVCFLEEAAKQGRIETIAFVVLTHPHRDHFRGLFEIIKRWEKNIKHFWDFGLKVEPIARYFHLVARDNDERQEAKEFANLYITIHRIRKDRNRKRHHFYNECSDFKIMSDGIASDIVVWSLSPFGDASQTYRDKISVYSVDDITHSPEGIKSIDHQMLSSVLAIKFHEHIILLGSDADKETWNNISNDSRLSQLMANKMNQFKVCYVKVPHHGSKSSLVDGLWSSLCISGTTIAAISADGIENPHNDTLSALVEAGAITFCTNIQCSDFPLNMKPASIAAWSPYCKPDVQRIASESYITATISSRGSVEWEVKNVYAVSGNGSEFVSYKRSS